MDSVLNRVIAVVSKAVGKNKAGIQVGDALDQEIGIYGDDGDDLVEMMCVEFGDWVADWPWHRFINFNDDPLGRSLHAIWRKFGWRGMDMAAPAGKPPAERLEIRHIAAVIEKGQWFDP